MAKNKLPRTTARQRTLDTRARAHGWASHSQFETAVIDQQVAYPYRPAGFLPLTERKRQEEQWLKGTEIRAAMERLGYRMSGISTVAILDALKTLGIRVGRVRPNADAARFRETARRLAEVMAIERD